MQLSELQLLKKMTAFNTLFHTFLTYLKDFQQCLHIEASDAKWHPKNGRNNDEDQQQGEPYSEGDAQQDAEQIIKGVEEELHPETKYFVLFSF